MNLFGLKGKKYRKAILFTSKVGRKLVHAGIQKNFEIITAANVVLFAFVVNISQPAVKVEFVKCVRKVPQEVFPFPCSIVVFALALPRAHVVFQTAYLSCTHV